jgi:hypothetical protein
MSDMKDGREFLSRKDSRNRYNPTAKFSRRLQSHDRPVKTDENLLPPDEPSSQFTTKKRP